VGLVQVTGLNDGFGFLPFGGGGSLGVRREVFLAVGGFDAIPFAEDVDLSWRLQLAGYEITFVPEARIAIAQRQDLRSMFRQHRRFGEAQAFLYQRYAARGMPRRGVAAAAAEWRRSLVGLLASRDSGQRARAVRRSARNIGRLIGSVRARVVYL
jgi:GT2 family glycosyltransferase